MERLKLLCVASALLALFSCGKEEKTSAELKGSLKTPKVKKEKICSEDTVLAEGRGITITLGDYRYAESLLNDKAREFFKNHPKELLNRVINRRLVIKYVEDSGIAQRTGLDREIEEFKKEYLARKYVSLEAKERAKKITDEDIKKRFKELFPDKDPSKMSEADKAFIRNELRVKAYDDAVSSIYEEAEKEISFRKEGKYLVGSACGKEIRKEIKGKEEAIRERIKRELLTECFYQKAVAKGYDREPDFERMLTEYFAGKAIEAFKKELAKGIKVSDEEVRDFYEKNKEKFRMPERAKAVVFYFKEKERAEEAKKLLESGEPWEKVARRFAQFNAKEKTYYKDTKDPIGVALFSIGNPKEPKPIIISLADNRYALIYPVKYIPEGYIPFERAKNYVALKLKEQKLRELEEEKLKELRKEYAVELKNLDCIAPPSPLTLKSPKN